MTIPGLSMICHSIGYSSWVNPLDLMVAWLSDLFIRGSLAPHQADPILAMVRTISANLTNVAHVYLSEKQ